MFNSVEATEKGKSSRSAILETALRRFRSHGFDATKMRDVAEAAGVALGATYYYFPSKDAIIQAYYDNVQSQHEERVRGALAAARLKLRDRLGVVFHSKLDILKDDRKVLGTIFRYTGEPEHPLSCLGPATQGTRERSIAIFAQALEGDSLPEDLRQVLPVALWALHMAILVFFIYDGSPQQQRTRRLVDGVLDLMVRLLGLTKSPLLRPFRGKLLSLLREVELLPPPGSALGSQAREEA